MQNPRGRETGPKDNGSRRMMDAPATLRTRSGVTLRRSRVDTRVVRRQLVVSREDVSFNPQVVGLAWLRHDRPGRSQSGSEFQIQLL